MFPPTICNLACISSSILTIAPNRTDCTSRLIKASIISYKPFNGFFFSLKNLVSWKQIPLRVLV